MNLKYNIIDSLTSKGISTSNHTVENYITAMLESFLIYKAERFDVKMNVVDWLLEGE